MFLASATPIMAQYYGVGEAESQLVLDKKVRSLSDDEFRDNIDKTVKVFYEDDLLEFSVLVKNSGNVLLENIKMVDQLPANLSLIFHPGEFDSQENKLVWQIDKLEVGEEKIYLIRAKIDNTEALSSANIVQRSNWAEGRVNDLVDNDTVSYFVGGMEVPDTGDAGLLVKTMLVLLTGTGGWIFRKYARGY